MLRAAGVALAAVAIGFGALPMAHAATKNASATSVSVGSVKATPGSLTVTGKARGLPAMTADAGDSSMTQAGTPAHVSSLTFDGIAPLTYAWSYQGSATRFATPTAATSAFDTTGLPTGPAALQLAVTDSRGAKAVSTVKVFVYSPVTNTVTKDGTIGPGLNYQLGYTTTEKVPFTVTPGTTSTDFTLNWDDTDPLATLPDPVGPSVSDLDLHVVDPSHAHDADSGAAGLTKPEHLHIDAPAAGGWTALVDDSTSGPVTYHLKISSITVPASPLPKISAGGSYRFAVGQAQHLNAAVSGGAAPYKVLWDTTGDGTFDVAGNAVTTTFGVGAHLVTAKVIDANGYTARETVPVKVVAPGSVGQASPYVVIAVVDTGINPYHADWAPSTYPDRNVLDDTANFTKDPASYITGYPKGTPALPVHLGQGYDPPADKDLWAESGATSKIQLSTLYWIPGTKIIGAYDSGKGDGGTGALDPAARILDTNGHGTASASVAVGNIYGTCGFCLLVVDKGLGDGWAYSQPWIDIVSNSFGAAANAGTLGIIPPTMPAAAAERGQLGLFAAGNGNEDAFVTPEQTYTSDDAGPGWVLRIGAVDRATRQPFLGTGKPVDASSFGFGNIPAADFKSVSGEVQHSGTSAATPQSAGVFATALGAARSALDDPGAGQRGGGTGVLARGASVAASPYLKDGVLTRAELVETVLGTARHGAEPPAAAFPEEIPPNPFQYAMEGYGILENASAQRAVNALVHGGPLEPVPSDEATFFAEDAAIRDALWGSWAGGGTNSAHASNARAQASSARLAAALRGLRPSSVSTFTQAMKVIGSLRNAAGRTGATPSATPGASPDRDGSISITAPGPGDLVSRAQSTIKVTGTSTLPASALSGTPTRYFVRRDQCGSMDAAKPDNPHLSRTEDTGGTDAGDGCGEVLQDLAPLGLVEFSSQYPMPNSDLPVVLGSGHPVRGVIELGVDGASPMHTITVQLVDGANVIGSQDVTESAVGIPAVQSGLTAFPFSFPVPDAEVGKSHSHLDLKVITRVSTAAQTGTETKGSYVDIPRALAGAHGATVRVAVDDAKFGASSVTATMRSDGSWTANVPNASLASGAHRLFAQIATDKPVASTMSTFNLATPRGPAVVQIVLTRRGATPYVVPAVDLTGTGTFAQWSAKIDTAKVPAGRYRMTARILQQGVEVSHAAPKTVTLR